MPYKTPQKQGKGYVLPKVAGGVHRSSKGRVVLFKSKAKAQAAARAIMAHEHAKGM